MVCTYHREGLGHFYLTAGVARTAKLTDWTRLSVRERALKVRPGEPVASTLRYTVQRNVADLREELECRARLRRQHPRERVIRIGLQGK